LLAAFVGDQAGQYTGADVLFMICQLAIGSPVLECRQAVSKCIGVAWGSALSLLTGHKIPVYLWSILVLTGVSR
jgi:sorbitol-specific phosphotransferase system component IIBC